MFFFSAGSTSTVPRKTLIEALRNKGPFRFQSPESRAIIINILKDKLNLVKCDKYSEKLLKCTAVNFLGELKKRWIKCHRTYDVLLKNCTTWVNGCVNVLVHDLKKPLVGRPTKTFNKSGKKTQQKKIKDLVDSRSPEELAFAAKTSLNICGKRDAAQVVEQAVLTTPKRASKFKKAYATFGEKMETFSAEEALALFIDVGLSKNGYQTLRNRFREKNIFILPCYDLLLEAKKKCLPAEDSTLFTEKSAEIKLQTLLDSTTTRLALVQQEAFLQLAEKKVSSLEFIHKWGFDGSSGQQQYKQKFSDQTVSDQNLFLTSIVPIQLSGQVHIANKIILWHNPRVSSTRYCRPIRFEYVKETKEVTKAEIGRMETEIKALQPTKVSVGNHTFNITHNLVMTMIDGKICNSLTDTSSQVCYICGASPKNMNDLEMVKKFKPKPEFYNFGLSILHAYIRFFECLLHIAYRLEVQKWQVRDKDEKLQVAVRKNMIIQKFRQETGLIVDQPKQGSGSSNDGNTARRFFANYEKSAEITGVNKELICRFGNILQALSSGFKINIKTFKNYSMDTAKLYVDLYNWFNMPASVHKILIHGADVIDQLILPIGHLSEEAQEARNKDYRNIRENHSRKSSRTNTNIDIFNYMWVSSDPVISSLRPLPYKTNKGAMSEEVLSLLKCDVDIE